MEKYDHYKPNHSKIVNDIQRLYRSKRAFFCWDSTDLCQKWLIKQNYMWMMLFVLKNYLDCSKFVSSLVRFITKSKRELIQKNENWLRILPFWMLTRSFCLESLVLLDELPYRGCFLWASHNKTIRVNGVLH